MDLIFGALRDMVKRDVDEINKLDVGQRHGYTFEFQEGPPGSIQNQFNDIGRNDLDVAFTGVYNLDTRSRFRDMRWSDLSVDSDGSFEQETASRDIQGRFYGPGHAEVGVMHDLELNLFQEALREQDDEIERLNRLLDEKGEIIGVAVRKIRRDANRLRELAKGVSG